MPTVQRRQRHQVEERQEEIQTGQQQEKHGPGGVLRQYPTNVRGAHHTDRAIGLPLGAED